MEKAGLHNILHTFEEHIYKILTALLSAAAGFFISKASLFSVLSPFSLSLIATAPFSGMFTWAVYAGSAAGFITKPFSIYNFKYICAETVLFILIIVAGKNNYRKNVYSASLPGFICLASGILFLFAEKFSIYSLLLTACEAVICGCFSYFLKYFILSAKQKTQFDARDIISFNICLLVLICALDSLYLYGFSIALIAVILMIMLCAYYLKSSTAALFSLPLCFIYALLHTANDKFIIMLYIPALICSAISKFKKRFTEASFIIPYFFISAVFVKISAADYPLYFAPVISGVLFKLIPKRKTAAFLKQYAEITTDSEMSESSTCNDLCEQYVKSTEALVKQINFTSLEPILKESEESKLKRSLIAVGCRSVSFANYISADGKQTLALYLKSETEPNKAAVLDRVSKATGKKLKISNVTADGNNRAIKFEKAFDYTIDCHALYKAKRGEKVCGDCVAAFRSSDDVYSIILADGMGSGEKAYGKSSSSVMILKKMLNGGVSVPNAIASVNASVSMQNEDLGFSTIDICSVSLKSAVAEFYKCGAYYSYILRGNKIIKIKPGGYPAGLLTKDNYSYFSTALEDGDLLIMMSDGVQNAIEQLQAKILMTDCREPAALTRMLIDCAYSSTPREYDDDMTVLIAKINKQTSE